MAKSHPTKPGRRSISTRICARRGCRYYGRTAVQGVCFHTAGEIADWKKIDAEEREVVQSLRAVRRRYKGREYVKWLEALYVSAMINWGMALDEVIRLRVGGRRRPAP